MLIENKVLRECLDNLNSLRLENSAYYKFVRNVKEILAEIDKLMSVRENPEEKHILQEIYYSVNHTLNKEVEDIKFKENEMNRSKVSSRIKQEHYELVSAACTQINTDLIPLQII